MRLYNPSSLLALAVVGCGLAWGSSIHDPIDKNIVTNLRRDDTVQLFNLTGVEGLSAKCVQAMESTVSCSNKGMMLIDQGDITSGIATPEKLTADDLAALCTAACSNSLASMSQAVDSACSDDVLVIKPSNATMYMPGTNTQENVYGGSNEAFRPSLGLDRILLNYKIGCLKDSALAGSDAWCYLRFNKHLTQACDDCEIGAFRAKMEDSSNYDPDLAAQYTSQVSSCGRPLTPIATPTKSVIVSSSTATETPTCRGTMVPVAADANCDDFARTHNIGTEQLLSLNGLTSGCVNFPGSKSSLCVVGSCKTYTVAKDDTCSSIVKAAGIAPIQFLTWNPMLSTRGCNADIARMVGHVVCISNPLQYTTPVITGTPPKTTTSAPASTRGFDQLEDMTSIWTHEPLPTQATRTYTGARPWITPTYDLAKGSLSGCYYMYDNSIDGLSCYAVASRYGVDEATWVSWNPSVQNGNLSQSGNCYLTKNTRYCGLFWNPLLAKPHNNTQPVYAPKPSDATPGATDKCYFWDKTPATSTDNLCAVFMANWKITIDEFYAWNPAVGDKCQHLWLDTSYCVSADDPTPSTTTTAPTSTTTGGAPAPTRPGTVKGCQQWYVAQPNDSCSDVATKYGITLAQFVAWNTDVNPTNCDGFWPSYAYCVKGPASTTTTSPQPTTTTNTKVTPPGPTQPGIPDKCNKYAVTKDGDGCEVFAQRNGITPSQLYAWNPALENACKNFWLGEAYCVGVSS